MKKVLFFVAFAAALVSCKIEGTEVETPKMQISLSMEIGTKATDTYFEQGDVVGIYVVNYNGSTAGTLASSGNHYDNVKHTLGEKWNAETPMYWDDKETHADFYCYYPYGTPTDVNSYSFSVKADQSSETDYKASDFIWGKATDIAPTENTIQIGTSHLMSNALIYVKPGSGFTAEKFAAADIRVNVCNVMTGAGINLADGTVTASGQTTDLTPFKENDHYRAIIVPQTVPSSADSLIRVTIDGVAYNLVKSFTFVSGEQHKFTVVVNKTSSGINVGISDWKSDGTDNGGSAE